MTRQERVSSSQWGLSFPISCESRVAHSILPDLRPPVETACSIPIPSTFKPRTYRPSARHRVTVGDGVSCTCHAAPFTGQNICSPTEPGPLQRAGRCLDRDRNDHDMRGGESLGQVRGASGLVRPAIAHDPDLRVPCKGCAEVLVELAFLAGHENHPRSQIPAGPPVPRPRPGLWPRTEQDRDHRQHSLRHPGHGATARLTSADRAWRRPTQSIGSTDVLHPNHPGQTDGYLTRRC